MPVNSEEMSDVAMASFDINMGHLKKLQITVERLLPRAMPMSPPRRHIMIASIKNWFKITPQFLMGWVHFFWTLPIAKNTAFLAALSSGNRDFVFMYFLMFRFRFSMMFVV